MERSESESGFTLVEIMIVVSIIALLAAIAIPNLLRAKIASNDTYARTTLRTISTASEAFASDHEGIYPGNISSLTGAAPPYINEAYCGQTRFGFVYTCAFAVGTYSFLATPSAPGQSGTTTYTITTGGILTP